MTKKKDKAEQVLHWLEGVEQRSIEFALDYQYLIQTDISDCYGSIYTHSIVWALHGKDVSKRDKRVPEFQKEAGSIIDYHLQDINLGQTNSIPQGSTLMDFMAEMVLGYADLELSNKIKNELEIGTDYHILRYRDDYRIFTNNPRTGELIVKLLSEVLADLGLKLNPSKTNSSNKVIVGSLKPDKHHWIMHKQSVPDIFQHLIIIHNFAEKHPNSGGLVRALNKFYRRQYREKYVIKNYVALISIVTDIALNNPRTYSICCAIISKIIVFVEGSDQKLALLDKVRTRFNGIPNTSHLELWLQRLTLKINRNAIYITPLCKLASGETVKIWNSDWLNGGLKSIMDNTIIIDEDIITNLDYIIPKAEVELFQTDY